MNRRTFLTRLLAGTGAAALPAILLANDMTSRLTIVKVPKAFVTLGNRRQYHRDGHPWTFPWICAHGEAQPAWITERVMLPTVDEIAFENSSWDVTAHFLADTPARIEGCTLEIPDWNIRIPYDIDEVGKLDISLEPGWKLDIEISRRIALRPWLPDRAFTRPFPV